MAKGIVVESCPCCEMEVEMLWDTKEDGFKAYCPYCGSRLMLCSECCDVGYYCDFNMKTDTCGHNKEGN